jgi:transposase
MARLMLRDDQWERIAHMPPDKPGDRGRTAVDNRSFVEAALWIGRSGYPGATYQSSLAPGAASINALRGGTSMAGGSESSP